MGLPLTSPCHRRAIVVLPWVRSPKAGSTTRTSGSLKYTDGAVKSLGGLVVVVGGVAGPAPPGTGGAAWSCGAASTPVGAIATAPAMAATALISVRRTIGRRSFGCASCSAMGSPVSVPGEPPGQPSERGVLRREPHPHRLDQPVRAVEVDPA